MITVVTLDTDGTKAYGTAVDDGAGYERFYGYCVKAPTPCNEETVAKALEAEK